MGLGRMRWSMSGSMNAGESSLSRLICSAAFGFACVAGTLIGITLLKYKPARRTVGRSTVLRGKSINGWTFGRLDLPICLFANECGHLANEFGQVLHWDSSAVEDLFVKLLEVELFATIPLYGLAKVVESCSAYEVGRELAGALFRSLNFTERFSFGLVASSHE